MIWTSCAALTRVARSRALDWLRLDRPGRLDVVGVVHAEGVRLLVHGDDEGAEAARVVAAESVGGAVFRRHQRQVQHFLAAQLRADLQARAAALFGVDVVVGDRDRLVERQARFGDDDGGHQLGERGDRQDRLRVLAEQDLVGVLVEDQGDARLQLERIGGLMQADQLAERRAGRLDAHGDQVARAVTAGADHQHLAHPRVGGDLRQAGAGGPGLRRLGGGLGRRGGAGAGEGQQKGRGDQRGAHRQGRPRSRRRESRGGNKNAQDQKLARCF